MISILWMAVAMVAAEERAPLLPPPAVQVRHRDAEWGPPTWPWEGAARVEG